VFLTNSIAHLVSGLQGRAFQSIFSKPPGVGLSSSRANVVWGWMNVVVGYLLVFQVGTFDLHDLAHAGAAFAGAFSSSLYFAKRFGGFHGGNEPLSAATK
jgi:hypothetical protein